MGRTNFAFDSGRIRKQPKENPPFESKLTFGSSRFLYTSGKSVWREGNPQLAGGPVEDESVVFYETNDTGPVSSCLSTFPTVATPNRRNKQADGSGTIVPELIHFTDFHQLFVARLADVVSAARIRGN